MTLLDEITEEAAKRYRSEPWLRMPFIEGAWWAANRDKPRTEVEKRPTEAEKWAHLNEPPQSLRKP